MPSKPSGKTKTPTQKPEEAASPPKRKSAPGALVKPDAKFSEPWMARWLEGAADATDMADACEKAKKSITDYLLARSADPEFDAACLVFDQVVELRIIDTIRRQAEEGAAPAQGAYFKSVRRPSFGPEFASWYKKVEVAEPSPEMSLPAEVAGAMIQAGLEAYERMNRPAELSANPPDDLHQLPGPAAQG